MKQLTVKVQPRSARTEWAGQLADGTLKVRVAAVPDKGQANEELIRFLAAEFKVGRKDVEIVSGLTSTLKRVQVRRLPE
jgi:uncharacterized protein